MVENGLSDSHRSAADASNANITTGITGLPEIVDWAPEVVICEEIDSERETDPLGDDLKVHSIYIKGSCGLNRGLEIISGDCSKQKISQQTKSENSNI